MDKTTKRIEWIDIAKGIAILLVVIAHTVQYGNTGPIIKNLIYSFHMPFFFIMSGYTSTIPTTTEGFCKKTKKLAFSLLLPTVSAFIIHSIINIFINKPCLDSAYFKTQLYSIIFSDTGNANYQDYITCSLYFLWFLVALFSCRTLYSYLSLTIKENTLPLVVCLCSLLGYIIGIQQKHNAFAFDLPLTVLPLMLVGQKIKNMNLTRKPYLYGIYSFFIWIISFLIIYPNPHGNGYLDIAIRKYPLYPLCFLPAIAATIFLCSFCIIFSKSITSKIFSFIGRNSIIYLIVHYFDALWHNIWTAPSDQYIRALLRLLTDLVVFLIAYYLLRIIKKMYFSKKNML